MVRIEVIEIFGTGNLLHVLVISFAIDLMAPLIRVIPVRV